MIKIIKEGKKENYKFKKTCSICGCEFEYELCDLYKEYDYNTCLTTYPPQYGYSRYVNCPCCKGKVFHDSGHDSNGSNMFVPCSITNDNIDCASCPSRPDPNKPVTVGDTPCTFCEKMTPRCK